MTLPKPSTALITGASSGIGAVFARQLAAQGYDLILVARRQERLQALANEVEPRYRVRVEALPADLATPAEVERIEQRIAACDTLQLLVNNAGFGIQGKFFKSDVRKDLTMIDVHVVASVRLSRAALTGMVARGRGAIINVSSVAAFFPSQGSPTYAATKAYLNAFSEALANELRGTGVKIQALCPGFTITEFHDTPEYQRAKVRERIPRFLWMKADKVVADSLQALERGQVYCIPGWHYRLAAGLSRIGLASLLVNIFVRRKRKRPCNF